MADHNENSVKQRSNNETRQPQASFLGRNPLLIAVIALAAAVYFVSGEEGPIKSAQNMFSRLGGSANEELPVTVAAKAPWELAEEDRLNLKPALDHLFGPEAEFRMSLLSDGEAGEVKRRNASLDKGAGNMFTKIDDEYYYLSKDGQRLYHCRINAELLSDKIAREQAMIAAREAEAARQQELAANEADNDTMIVYSPSRISGERFEFAQGKTDGGIYLDRDGTWKNY